MKTTISIACCLVLACLAGVPGPAPAQEKKQKSEKFSALAHMPHGGRRSTANVDLYVNSYTSDEEAKVLGAALLDGGPDVLHKALEKADTIGRVSLTGRVGFYHLKLIRSRPTETGRRIIGVGDRPMGFLELYYSGRSTDYNFGIVVVDLKRDEKGKEKGEGILIYAAEVKLLDGNKLEIENFGIEPIRLMAVRKL